MLWEKWRYNLSIKSRMKILLVSSAVLPLLLICFFTNRQVYQLYRKNTDAVISNELENLKSNMDELIDSMKYMSQQLTVDDNLTGKLRDYFTADNVILKLNSMDYLAKQIAVYEVANPNINNISFLYYDDGVLTKINESSLARAQLPESGMRLCRQNLITLYGPHDTRSKAGRYPVVSLVRTLSFYDTPEIILYIESGYKQMEDFSAATLDQMDAIYTVVSDTGQVVYSSSESVIPCFQEIPESGASGVTIHDRPYLPYALYDKQGWSLQIFVPKNIYNRYIHQINIGFLLITALATGLSFVVCMLIWKSIYKPLRAFQENLDNILGDDIEARIQKIHVRELDQNLEYFHKMKLQILSLIQAVKIKEREKSQLEIKHLMSKINPHFIHNTLDTLKWYASQKEYCEVETFVSSLNELLMYNMEKDKTTTLASELDAITRYITIQQLKYNLDFYIENTMPAPMLQTECPRFLLQPLVENAIFHGLEGNGRIHIHTSVLQNGKISIRIYNNGTPIDVEKIHRILKSKEDISNNGIGIQYVVQSLESAFPHAYEFRAENVGNESCIEIILPFTKGGYYAKDSDC